LLPAITVDSYLAHRIFQGAITAKLIDKFLQEDVLPHLINRYHVLLIDNASIHQSPAIVQLCRDFSIQLEYLPPYSPNYNPIKKTFKVLKSWIKQHYQQQEEWLNFRFFMELAVLNSCYGFDCRSWYRKCGYVGVDDA
jgi:transposase